MKNPKNNFQMPGEHYHLSIASNGDPEVLDVCLTKIRSEISGKHTYKSEEQEQKKLDLEAEIKKCEIQEKGFNKAIERELKIIDDYQKADDKLQKEESERRNDFIKEMKEEQDRRKKNKEGKTSMRISIGYLILAGLTIFLFIFYSSAMHSAFIRDVASEIAQTFSTTGDFIEDFNSNERVVVNIINLNAIQDSFTKYGIGGLFFALAAPFFFIAIGFLAHILKAKVNIVNKKYKWLLLGAPYLIALLLDIFLAHHIVKDVHIAKYNSGLEPLEWSSGLLFFKIDFYLILLTGFVGYIIWGLLFDFLLEQKETFSEFRKQREKEERKYIQNIQDQRSRYSTLINECRKKINQIKAAITQVEQKIRELKSQLIKIAKNKPVPFDEVMTLFDKCFLEWISAISKNDNIGKKSDLVKRCKDILIKQKEDLNNNFFNGKPPGSGPDPDPSPDPIPVV